MSQSGPQDELSSQNIDYALESIGKSIQNAGQQQNKRQAAENLKNLYYQKEIDRLRDDLQAHKNQNNFQSPESIDNSESNEEYEDEYQEDNGQDISDEDNESMHMQDLNQNQTPDSRHKIVRISDQLIDYKDDFERQDPSEQDQYPIQSVYIKIPSKPAQSNQAQQTLYVVKKTTKKPQINKNIQASKKISTDKQIIDDISKLLPFKSSTLSNSQKFKVKVEVPTQDQSDVKENMNLRYLENVYDSDLALEHMKKRNELQYLISTQQQVHDKCLQTQNRFTTKITDSLGNTRSKIQSSRIERSGRERPFRVSYKKQLSHPMPCQECASQFSLGLSSDYCSYHGKQVKETPPSQQVPRRLAKFY